MDKLWEGNFTQKPTAEKKPLPKRNKYICIVSVHSGWINLSVKKKKNQFCTCENKNKCHGSIDIAASFYPKLSTKMGKYHIFIGSVFWFLPSEIKTSKHYAITTEGSLSAMLLPFSLSFPPSEVRTPNTSRKGSGLSSVHSQTQWSAFIIQGGDAPTSVHEPLKKRFSFLLPFL